MGVSVDLDYFTVTVPAGQALVALNVLPGTVGGGAIGSFIGVYSGPTAVDPAGALSTAALGYYLYRAADIGTDILDNIATFNFNGPIPPSVSFRRFFPAPTRSGSRKASTAPSRTTSSWC
jgi:hypothetical protein